MPTEPNNAPISPRTAPLERAPAATVRHLILGTAGHIDHGKTTLIEALTGTNTDRLPEERKRGMTIELGFAQLQIGDTTFGIVDVPGHERFVRTMVAGATGIDLALVIVAADDSVMPQTIEHVEILDLLGIRHGVVAITKCDLVDEDLAELVEADVHDLLERTGLKDAPVVHVSAAKRTGLDELRAKLAEVAKLVIDQDLDRPFRMPVDRVFSVAGRGTVVTGSVITGRLERGATIEIWPAKHQARAREIQTHGHSVDVVTAGQRTAINLQGVDRDAIERGDELAAVGAVEPTRLMDAHLTCLASHERPIKNHSRLRLCIGTREVLVRCATMTGKAIAPGSDALIQLRCAEPVTVTYGQRFIVRDENAARTAGGGVVLRAARHRISPRHTADVQGLEALLHGGDTDRVGEVLRDHRFSFPDQQRIALAAGVSRAAVPDILDKLANEKRVVTLPGTERAVTAAHLDATLERLLRWLHNYHTTHPDEPGCLVETVHGRLDRLSDKGLGKILFKSLVDGGRIKIMGRYACLPEFAPSLSAQDEKMLAAIVKAIDSGAFQPPTVADLLKLTGSNKQRVDKLLKVACSTGQLVQVDPNTYLHPNRDAELRETARRLHEQTGGFTVSEIREALGSSRKYVVPIVEYLDRTGVTRRRGDKRELVQRDTS